MYKSYLPIILLESLVGVALLLFVLVSVLRLDARFRSLVAEPLLLLLLLLFILLLLLTLVWLAGLLLPLLDVGVAVVDVDVIVDGGGLLLSLIPLFELLFMFIILLFMCCCCCCCCWGCTGVVTGVVVWNSFSGVLLCLLRGLLLDLCWFILD